MFWFDVFSLLLCCFAADHTPASGTHLMGLLSFVYCYLFYMCFRGMLTLMLADLMH